MSINFQELDYQQTPIGAISLRRRRNPTGSSEDVFEIKLGDEYLMSSLFHEVEVALADLGLADLTAPELDVVVGGLGLGYTAAAALKQTRVRSLLVVEFLEAVIDWHRRGLLPLAKTLTQDPRCQFVHADFFALARGSKISFDPHFPERRFHAILLDIDHSPSKPLQSSNLALYTEAGLKLLTRHLHPDGVFALWSDDPPSTKFMALLQKVFNRCEARVVKFSNPLLERESENTVYIARLGPA